MIRNAMMIGATAAAVGLSLTVGFAAAHAPLVSKAKSAGLPAQNCQYCHVSKMPKKDTYKPEDLNERGKWMMTEKEKRQAKDVQAAWLKDYPGGKEQK
jgi:hypothetical protein